jgi:hypothetical protein
LAAEEIVQQREEVVSMAWGSSEQDIFASTSLDAAGSFVADLVNTLRNLAMAPDVGVAPLFLLVMNAFSRTPDLMILPSSSPPCFGAFPFSAFTVGGTTGDVDPIGSSKSGVGL